MSTDREVKVHLQLYAEGYRAGLQQAAEEAKRFAKNTKPALDDVANGHKKVQDAQKLGAEQITKYGTAAAALSGNMQNLGIQGDAISKTLATVQAGMSGMLGPAGIAVVAIGAVVAAIAGEIKSQKELDEATKTATKSLLEQIEVRRKSKQVAGAAVETATGIALGDITKERAEIVASLKTLDEAALRGTMHYAKSGWEVALTESKSATKEFEIEVDRLNSRLSEIDTLLGKAKGSASEIMGPAKPDYLDPLNRYRAEEAAQKAIAQLRTQHLALEIQDYTAHAAALGKSWTDSARKRMDIQATGSLRIQILERETARAIQDVRGNLALDESTRETQVRAIRQNAALERVLLEEDTQKQIRDIQKETAKESLRLLGVQIDAERAAMSERKAAADDYAANERERVAQATLDLESWRQSVQSFGVVGYQVLTREAQKAATVQGLLHLQVGRIYIRAIREGLAAYLEAEGQKNALMAAEMAAYAIGAAASLQWGQAAAYGVAAAKFAAIAGAYAVGASVVRGSIGGEGTGGGMSPSELSSGGGTSSGRGSTAVSVGGSAPETVNYNLTIVHSGATIYGDGGLRELWEDLVPYLREYETTGRSR